MEFLETSELQERVFVLNKWLNEHGEEHFHYRIVKAERDYYSDQKNEIDEYDRIFAECSCLTDCYNQIKNGVL